VSSELLAADEPLMAGPATLKYEKLCVGPVTRGRLRRLSRITSGSQANSPMPHSFCVGRSPLDRSRRLRRLGRGATSLTYQRDAGPGGPARTWASAPHSLQNGKPMWHWANSLPHKALACCIFRATQIKRIRSGPAAPTFPNLVQQFRQVSHDFRMLRGQVVGFARVGAEIVKLRARKELPGALADCQSAGAVGLHHEMVAQRLVMLLAEKSRQHVEAVRPGLRRQSLSVNGGAGGEHIHQAEEFIGLRARFDHARPTRDEGLAISTFPQAAFEAAQPSVAQVAMGVPDIEALVAIIYDSAIMLLTITEVLSVNCSRSRAESTAPTLASNS